MISLCKINFIFKYMYNTQTYNCIVRNNSAKVYTVSFEKQSPLLARAFLKFVNNFC